MSDDRKTTHTPKITAFTSKLQEYANPLKRSCSLLSPTNTSQKSKKAHTSKVSMSNVEGKESAEDMVPHLMQDHFKQWMEPIMQEFQSLKDMMSMQKSQITEEIGHLKMVMKEQKAQIVEEINVKVETNKVKISQIINKNVNLHKENIELQDRVSKLESTQLTNNIIISGTPEQPF